jgi:hypothetical protein
LENAYDRFASESGDKKAIDPFTGSFTTPNPYFAYIGSQGEEKGRLIIYDARQKDKRVLTPANLSVLDFRIYPERPRQPMAKPLAGRLARSPACGQYGFRAVWREKREERTWRRPRSI